MEPKDSPTIESVPGVPLDGQPAPPPNEPVTNLPDGGDLEPKKRPKREVPDHLKPASLAAYDAETVKLANALDGEIDTLHVEYTNHKEETKEAKIAHEAKRDALQRLLKERKANRGKPVQKTLLSDLPPEQPAEAPPAQPVIAVVPPEPSERDTLWRRFPIARLVIHGATERDVEILAAGERKGGLATIPVRTVGEMADYTAGDGTVPRHVADFKGLGASGSTRIDAALENFWGWWNKDGLTEFAREMGIPDAVNDPESGGRGEAPGAGGDGHLPSERGGAGDGDDSDGADTVVTVEYFPNDPAGAAPTDEDLAAIPQGNDAEYSLADDQEGE